MFAIFTCTVSIFLFLFVLFSFQQIFVESSNICTRIRMLQIHINRNANKSLILMHGILWCMILFLIYHVQIFCVTFEKKELYLDGNHFFWPNHFSCNIFNIALEKQKKITLGTVHRYCKYKYNLYNQIFVNVKDSNSSSSRHKHNIYRYWCFSFFWHECQTKFINTAIMMSFTATISIAMQLTIWLLSIVRLELECVCSSICLCKSISYYVSVSVHTQTNFVDFRLCRCKKNIRRT